MSRPAASGPLREKGHDAVHLRELGLKRLPDPEILEKARQEGRIVLAFDLDFGELLAIGVRQFPSAIVFRLRKQTPSYVTPRLLEVVAFRSRELAEGAIVIVEDARHRVRRLPIEESEENP